MPGSMPGMSAPPTPSLPSLPGSVKRPVRRVVIHCSATPSGQRLARPGYKTVAAVIDSWHAERGFKRGEPWRSRHNAALRSIGYHFVVDLDGSIWTGRHLEEVGAHVAGHNSDSVGICLVGGAEKVARYSAAQWTALWALVNRLCVLLGVPLVPGARIGIAGHRDLSPDTDGDGQVEPHEWLKTCPGFDVASWLRAGGAVAPALVVEVPAP